MKFLKRLFSHKPEAPKSLTPELDGIFQDLQRTIIALKNRIQVSYVVIVPALFKIGSNLLVKSRGLDATCLLYEDFLADLDRTQNVSSGAIFDINFPEQPLHHTVEVTNPEPEAVPLPGDAERPLPDARREISGGTEGK